MKISAVHVGVAAMVMAAIIGTPSDGLASHCLTQLSDTCQSGSMWYEPEQEYIDAHRFNNAGTSGEYGCASGGCHDEWAAEDCFSSDHQACDVHNFALVDQFRQGVIKLAQLQRKMGKDLVVDRKNQTLLVMNCTRKQVIAFFPMQQIRSAAAS
jgi:hypothetical protein